MRSDVSSLCLKKKILNSYCKKSINLKVLDKELLNNLAASDVSPLLSSMSSAFLQRHRLCGSKGGMGSSHQCGQEMRVHPFPLPTLRPLARPLPYSCAVGLQALSYSPQFS